MDGTRHYVADVNDFPDDRSRIFTEVDGREIAVFEVEDEFFGVLNFCVHASGPLCEGPLTGRVTQAEGSWQWGFDETNPVVVCPWHNWKFDVRSGECIDDSRYAVPTYDIEEREGALYVVV